ncbi:MAG: AEC family transporter [Defluviitaleaceae bacterium]|nr:AEC family transporter [Defluviitaleaceae bacterium]
MFTAFTGSLLTLLVCAAAGAACRRGGLLDDKMTSGLSNLMFNVTVPCTVFVSLMRPFSRALLWESFATFFLSGAIYLSCGLIGFAAYKVYRRKKQTHKGEPLSADAKVLIFACVFANVGYMGFPVVQAVFGEEGMIYASMANASFNMLTFTLGVRLFGQKSEKKGVLPVLKSVFFNAALIATFIGFAFFMTGLRLPGPLYGGVAMLGAMTAPVSMLIIGSILAKNPLRNLFNDKRIFPAIIARLFIFPAAAFFALRPFVANETMLGVIVVLTAMPVAMITAIFAERYQRGAEVASKAVALSTLFSVVTVPLVALMIGI